MAGMAPIPGTPLAEFVDARRRWLKQVPAAGMSDPRVDAVTGAAPVAIVAKPTTAAPPTVSPAAVAQIAATPVPPLPTQGMPLPAGVRRNAIGAIDSQTVTKAYEAGRGNMAAAVPITNMEFASRGMNVTKEVDPVTGAVTYHNRTANPFIDQKFTSPALNGAFTGRELGPKLEAQRQASWADEMYQKTGIREPGLAQRVQLGMVPKEELATVLAAQGEEARTAGGIEQEKIRAASALATAGAKPPPKEDAWKAVGQPFMNPETKQMDQLVSVKGKLRRASDVVAEQEVTDMQEIAAAQLAGRPPGSEVALPNGKTAYVTTTGAIGVR